MWGLLEEMKLDLSFVASIGDSQGSKQRAESSRQKGQAAGKQDEGEKTCWEGLEMAY